jgi:hypothetical protein
MKTKGFTYLHLVQIWHVVVRPNRVAEALSRAAIAIGVGCVSSGQSWAAFADARAGNLSR